MRLAHTIALAVLAGAASVLPAAAKTLRVPQTFPTITEALAAANSGDKIVVSPKPGGGVYNEALTMNTPNIVLKGKNGAILDGTNLGIIDLFGFYEGPDGIDIDADHVTVSGLTVQNFAGSQFSDNSAVNVGYFDSSGTYQSNSDIQISDCTICNNHKGIRIGDPSFSPVLLPNYKVINNTITNNDSEGASVVGSSAVVTGNRISHNGFNAFDSTGDGLDAFGSGLSISGNEFASNGGQGLTVTTILYDPSVNDPQNPNPAASTVNANDIHGNNFYGLSVSGTVAVSANAVFNNVGYGIYLAYADFSTVSQNICSGNIPSTSAAPGDPFEAGVGIYANINAGLGPLTISANQIIGNAGDGILLNQVDHCTISYNFAAGNTGIGIHLSDQSGNGIPNVITRNVGQYNYPVDAQDDVLLAGGSATNNVWTKNKFGSTNPPGLGGS